MSTISQVANVPGRITIRDVVLSVASLNMRGEQAIYAELKSLVDDGTLLWRRIEPVLDRLEKSGNYAQRVLVIESTVRLILDGADVAQVAVDQARRTNPLVLAREIYLRAKPFHANLEPRELEAVITSVNVGEIFTQLEAALGKSSDPKAETPSPSPV